MSCGCSPGVTGFEEKARWWSYRRQQLGREVVLVDGAAAGAWGARSAGGAGLRVDLDLFERPGASLARVIEERVEEMAALLGARSVFLG
jgi:hypothetical protein